MKKLNHISLLLTLSSSSAPQLDAAPKAEAGAEQRMELQREVEALRVGLEKQVGTASVGERRYDARRASAADRLNCLRKLIKLCFFSLSFPWHPLSSKETL